MAPGRVAVEAAEAKKWEARGVYDIYNRANEPNPLTRDYEDFQAGLD